MVGSIVPLTGGAAAFWASIFVGVCVATCAACIGIFFFTKRGKRQVLKLADYWIPMPRYEDEEHRWDEADGATCRAIANALRPSGGETTNEAAIDKGGAVMKTILGYLRDERGLETMEWIAIGALVLGVAFVIYPGVLQTALTTVVGNISNALTTGITLP